MWGPIGLDNGIVLEIKNKEKFGELKTPLEKVTYSGVEEYDIFYWRKCWHVRTVVMSLINCEDNGNGYLNVYDLYRTCIALEVMYTDAAWQEAYDDGLTIWDTEILPIYRERLEIAQKLLVELESKPVDSYEIRFYDSY